MFVSKFFPRILDWAVLIAFLFCLVILPQSAVRAAGTAKLWLNPSNETRYAGEVFSVNIFLNSLQSPVNAISGELSYPKDLLEVERVSLAGSILSVWLEEPTLDEETGHIRFSGGLTQPGYTGAQGLVFSLSFRALEQGTASIAWEKSEVLANDGKGSPVLGLMEGATFNISPNLSSEVINQQDGTIETTSVPVPVVSTSSSSLASVFLSPFLWMGILLISSLGVFAEFRRRKKQLERVTREQAAQVGEKAKMLVDEKFNSLQKEILAELWHLEQKMKKGEPFSREERERRQRLVQELGLEAADLEKKLKEL